MANVNKPAAIQQMTGIGAPDTGAPQPALPSFLPPDGQANGLALAQGGDNIPAQIHDQQGNPQGPAAIKSGELIFPVEAIIGAGNGDYNKGAEMLLNLMQKLAAHGTAVASKASPTASQGPSTPPQGLAAAVGQ